MNEIEECEICRTELLDCDCGRCHNCHPEEICITCGGCHTDSWESGDCWESVNNPDYDPFDI